MKPKILDAFWTGLIIGFSLGLLLGSITKLSSFSSKAGRPQVGAAGSFSTSGSGLLPLPGPLPIIERAAERNGIEFGSEDWFILLAIRKAENGRDELAWGIMNPKANTFELQAAWCAATIVKNRVRWSEAGMPPPDFISFLGRRYCPPNVHPLNKHWVKNVRYWFNKLQE